VAYRFDNTAQKGRIVALHPVPQEPAEDSTSFDSSVDSWPFTTEDLKERTEDPVREQAIARGINFHNMTTERIKWEIFAHDVFWQVKKRVVSFLVWCSVLLAGLFVLLLAVGSPQTFGISRAIGVAFLLTSLASFTLVGYWYKSTLPHVLNERRFYQRYFKVLIFLLIVWAAILPPLLVTISS
jgi:hypothetical protein